MKITETFKRVDPEMIAYTARIEDPVTYTAPFTIRLMITKQPNYETPELKLTARSARRCRPVP